MPRIGKSVGRTNLLPLTLASSLMVLVLACSRSANEEAGRNVPRETETQAPASTHSQSLQGRVGASTQWGSGWIDLDVVASFKQGEKLQITVGGTAHSILVRFLPEGGNPNDPVGIDGGIIKVPENRIVQVTLQEDHENVEQISVHGGPNPWDLYPMGDDNGPAIIHNVQRIAP